GEPARIAIPTRDDTCVVVVRDAKLADDAPDSAWMIEGPIPGVGRVQMAGVPGAAGGGLNSGPLGDVSNDPVLAIGLGYGGPAALRGGGFADGSWITTDEGGIVGTANPALPEAPLSGHAPGVPDLGGAGFWVADQLGSGLGAGLAPLGVALVGPHR